MNLSEAVALRYIIRYVIEHYLHEGEGFVLMEAQEMFFRNVVKLPGEAFDPKRRDGVGLSMSRDEIRAIWLKYERDSEVPYDEWTDLEKAKKNVDVLPVKKQGQKPCKGAIY